MEITLNLNAETVALLERFMDAADKMEKAVSKLDAPPVAAKTKKKTAKTEKSEPAKDDEPEKEKPVKLVTATDIKKIKAAVKKSSADKQALIDLLKEKYGVDHTSKLPQSKLAEFIMDIGAETEVDDDSSDDSGL